MLGMLSRHRNNCLACTRDTHARSRRCIRLFVMAACATMLSSYSSHSTFAAPDGSLPRPCARSRARPSVGPVLAPDGHWPTQATRRTALPVAAASHFHIPRHMLLLAFILVDTGQALAMDWAEKRSWDKKRTGLQYARQTVIVCESILAIIIGLCIACASGGMEGVRQCFSVGRFLKFLPVSVCFALGLSLKMMAVDHFQAGTIKIFGQLRMPLVAVVSTLLLARRYSALQWQAIGLITMSCIAFVMLKSQSRTRAGKQVKWTGFLQMIGWISLNVFGGIVAEKMYKSKSVPFYAQKVSEDFGYLLLGTVMLFFVVPRYKPEENILDRKVRPGGFFDSWDLRAFVVVIFLLLDAFVGNLLLKEFSAVTKSIAKAFGVAAVYFISLAYSKDRKSNPVLTIIAVIVIQSSVLFAFTR